MASYNNYNSDLNIVVNNGAGNVFVNGNLNATSMIVNSINSGDSTFVTINDGLTVEGAVQSLTVATSAQTFSQLTAQVGSRALITDGNLSATGNFGLQISGSGSNVVPVWSDGTFWYVG
jgi:hypothetical protein